MKWSECSKADLWDITNISVVPSVFKGRPRISGAIQMSHLIGTVPSAKQDVTLTSLSVCYACDEKCV